MFRLASAVILVLLVSPVAWADDDWDEYPPGYYVERVYVPQPIVEYVPVQPVYYAPPPIVHRYYAPVNGLAGAMLGSALGYELGMGDPLAAGIGAAAGAWWW
ncbi:MAG: hypothetical protein ACU836_11410 [Gammaproteobacteria bacterium]